MAGMTSQNQNTFSSRVTARVGLLGNPSDGMEGAALAVSISNFAAVVTLHGRPDATIDIKVHPEHDMTSFSSFEGLFSQTEQLGYYGGHRLLLVRNAHMPARSLEQLQRAFCTIVICAAKS